MKNVVIVLQVSRATGEAFAKNSNALFIETSAKDGSNVHDLFRTIGIYDILSTLYAQLSLSMRLIYNTVEPPISGHSQDWTTSLYNGQTVHPSAYRSFYIPQKSGPPLFRGSTLPLSPFS